MSSSLARHSVQRLQVYLRRLRLPFSTDLGGFVNSLIFFIALITSIRSTIVSLYNYIRTTFLVSVIIPERHAAYDELLRWMQDFKFRDRDFLSVKVSSTESTQPNVLTLTESIRAAQIDGKHSSNRTQEVYLRPFQGSRIFRFANRFMLFKHHSPRPDDVDPRAGVKRSHIEVQCFSTSLAPLRKLLAEARSHNETVSVSSTTVWRPISQGRDFVQWRKIASRPARDISTVIIDRAEKKRLLADVEEYLHPRTRLWYSNHGIPYRRGYLFSGPPGTGKTSLAAALAGVFTLDIYVLSLQDPSVNESVFQKLLSEVPSPSILLLEDIDVAGLARAQEPVMADPRQTTQNPPISLSCLLNAVDGVSSQEGRILIMSTNYPDQIDKALTRPGRVDFHLRFALPSKEQLSDLFLSIYSDVNIGTGSDTTTEGDEEKSRGGIGVTSLHNLAEKFAARMPVNRFSAADVQGYLLGYKRDPERACNEVDEWLEKNSSKE